ncbi:MAG: Rid family detoxifying hydrolase [Bacteriovoracaceae bacterium]
MKKIISTDLAPAAVGTYSQGVEVNGTFYFSGQIGLDPKTMEMRPDFKTQIEQIFQNIDGLLKSQNLNRENIVKSTVFVTSLTNFPMVNEAFETFFKPPYPARSTVELSKLPKDGLVEIEIIAVR